MANNRQSKKRIRQSEKHRKHNASLRSMLRTFIKKVYNSIEAKDLQLARINLRAAIPIIDRIASKGLIHKNKAARHKSSLELSVKNISI
jgi:small subunit ribosomal protein S20